MKRGGEPFRFRVSDAVEMPLRGFLLRLRVLEGRPAVADLAVGGRLRLASPSGRERVIRIHDHAVTAGRQTQERLDRLGEFDIVIVRPDAFIDDECVEIGWTASGPVADDGGRRG
jgi:hypothetical protein